MKPSLRSKYFGWLITLILITYLLFALILLLFNAHEMHEHAVNTEEEAEELFALLGMMLVTVPVVVWAAWIIAGRLLNPLQNILATAEHIRGGHLDERIPALAHQDELSRLAETINDAFDRYAAAVRRLEHFSADAAHQLRTPLAALRTTAEVALQAGRTSSFYEETLGEILEQTGKLNQTLSQLLLLSRLDRSMRDTFTAVDLGREMSIWIEDAKAVMDGLDLEFSSSVNPGAVIQGNPVLLREAFNNLVNNAVAFTPPGGKIHVALTASPEDRVHIRVEDSGPGIPEPDRDRVFDRFFRGATSTHPGSGLGLSIVREIVLLHGGTVRAERSALLGGAAMAVDLPALYRLGSAGNHPTGGPADRTRTA